MIACRKGSRVGCVCGSVRAGVGAGPEPVQRSPARLGCQGSIVPRPVLLVLYTARATMTDVLAILGRRVRQARAERSWTIRELAERSGVSVRFLVQLESGRGNI